MEWSRIKTIILIILAVTNVSLLGFLVQREFQVQNARQEARQNSIQFLKNNGVTVEDETVPEEMTLLPQTVKWDRGQEREAAAVLLGGEVQEQAWSDEIYRYYNETGSIQFHRDGTFQGEFVEGAFRLEEQDAAAYSLQILEILGIQGESLSVQADGGEEDDSLIREMEYNEIICYEQQSDWENAKAKITEYISKYPDDEAAQREAEFLQTR